MGIDEILKLIESLQDTDIQELEISNGDSKVRIVRLMPVPVAAVPQGIQVVPVVPTPTTDVSIEDEGGVTNHILKSPHRWSAPFIVPLNPIPIRL